LKQYTVGDLCLDTYMRELYMHFSLILLWLLLMIFIT